MSVAVGKTNFLISRCVKTIKFRMGCVRLTLLIGICFI